jgi:hypothetical protein
VKRLQPYLLLAVAALLLVVAFTGSDRPYINIGVAVLLAIAGVIVIVQQQRARTNGADSPPD